MENKKIENKPPQSNHLTSSSNNPPATQGNDQLFCNRKVTLGTAGRLANLVLLRHDCTALLQSGLSFDYMRL